MHVVSDTYTAIAEKLRDIGGIDDVGVVSKEGQTAIVYSGGKDIKKYFDGMKKQSVLFQISGMCNNDSQPELVKRLCAIGETLKKSTPEIIGISQPKIRINSPPTPKMHDQHYWIYSMTAEIIFYTKG